MKCCSKRKQRTSRNLWEMVVFQNNNIKIWAKSNYLMKQKIYFLDRLDPFCYLNQTLPLCLLQCRKLLLYIAIPWFHEDSCPVERRPTVWKQARFADCAQTIFDAIPQIGIIHIFSKIAVTFKPMMQFWYLLRLRMPLTCEKLSILWLNAPFLTGLGGAVKQLMNQIINYNSVFRAVPGFAWVC